jgi:hypothetical protein
VSYEVDKGGVEYRPTHADWSGYIRGSGAAIGGLGCGCQFPDFLVDKEQPFTFRADDLDLVQDALE